MNLFAYLAPFYDLLLARVQKRQQNTVLSNIKNLKGCKLLDLGGGTGKLAGTLLQAGADIYLLDASSALLKHARKRLPPERAVLGDAASLPFGEDTFDLVLLGTSTYGVLPNVQCYNFHCVPKLSQRYTIVLTNHGLS